MSSDKAGLIFRAHYFDDRAAWQGLCDLLRDIFEIDVSGLDRLGGPDPTSAPFGFFDADGTCIANITAFAMPLVIDGVFVRAAGLQSGAVRPSHRGRGLYRAVMEAALDHCNAEGFEAVVLLTDTPALYEKHGFRPLPQHRFAGVPPTGGRAFATRRLHLANEADLTLLSRLLDGRAPVSDRFAPLRQKEMFLFNASLMPDLKLDLLEEAGAVVAWQADGEGNVDILDIVGTRMPALADILASLDVTPQRVTVHFAPDHLAWDGEAIADDGEMVLMLRGPDDLQPALPFALPPMAAF
ncbi:GNAT family N-acetyltransferase [Shinella oryzae]|uniref:GNAT family N-acetyltransferase n=1 Tax=Shinella oryzae TaxID=2871820 RepID=UPI001FF365D0|nr:GNAT family N-acetyltransferase [Shinella oryzae]UPA24635.1 GNAT family N-acetyltransferase [Shinella oryzae]